MLERSGIQESIMGEGCELFIENHFNIWKTKELQLYLHFIPLKRL